MMDDELIRQYKEIISTYIEKGDERSLYEISGLARACLARGLGPEVLVEFHSSTLYGLMEGRDFEVRELVTRANQVLLEAMMTYGLIYQELLERKSGEYKSLEVYTKKIEKQAEQLKALYTELEIANSGTIALYKELDEKNKQLLELDRLKSQFLANMSHELRTPLNSIIGFTGIILQGLTGKITDEQKKQLEMVYDSGKHLLTLINDILDLSKIAADRMEVMPETFYLAEIIDSVIAMITPLSDTKNLKLIATNMPPPGFEIYSDKNKVKQIIINLLNNAVKYTERGQIEISITFTTESDEIEISVSDTGIGIKEEALDSIFDEFRQIEGTVVRDKGGVGLGLSISKKLVELLKGKIRAESEHGIGSKFTFSLPLQVPPAKPEIPILEETAAATRLLVLTVEDDPKAQEMLRVYLEDNDYRVIQAYTAIEAIKLAKEHKIYAITLDIMMPGRDGWDILQELKSTPETAAIPVIIISITDNRQLGLSKGAIAYLVKPIDYDELIRTLRNIERENGIKINKALVVDDNPADVELITALLDDPRIDGRDVLKAYGGAEGLELANEHQPDIIILDLIMPDMDGFEVIKRLRRRKTTKNIPVLIVTGKELSAKEHEFLRENIQHIMVKGKFTKKVLLQSIKKALERVGKR